jgi:hypothetical protein
VPPEPARRPWLQFFGGVGLGLAFSVVYYVLAAMTGAVDRVPGVLFGAILLKTVAGILIIVQHRRWRPLGIGLLVSGPMAVLLFVTACFGVLIFNPPRFG